MIDHVDDASEPAAIAKAYFFGGDGEQQVSNVRAVEERFKDHEIFSRAGAISPPYPPETLCKLFEHSSALRPNVDAYAVNIDGHGHRFEPVIDLDDEEAFERVRDAMMLDSIAEMEASGELEDGNVDVVVPSDDEVEKRIEELSSEMRLEKARLEAFFRFACVERSFVKLRRDTRQDVEVIGNGFWEVIRNRGGAPCQFTYVPGFTVRLLPIDKEPTPVEVPIKRTPFTYQMVKQQRRFRRYVQVFEGSRVYFKEYGDPRVISSKTGKVYQTPEQLKSQEEGVAPATEIIHFLIHSPYSPYGVPRWIGALLAVLGSRQADEVNFLYFDNKSVPPLALLVSGGRLNPSSVERIESYIKNEIKGRANFHKILVIEAAPASEQGAALEASMAAGRMRIELRPLTDAQQKDALFLNYDERNTDKVGMAFRLPRLLRGDIRDFNRATADAALEFTETQVFSPERSDFDWTVNRTILSELGIRFWHFVSNSPDVSNALDLAQIIATLVKEAVITPAEAREIAQAVFHRDFKKLDDVWTRIPPSLLMAGILPDDEGGVPEVPSNEPRDDPDDDDPTPPDPNLEDDEEEEETKRKKRERVHRNRNRWRKASLQKAARDLIALRRALEIEEKREAETTFSKAHEEMEREVVHVPAEIFKTWFEPGDA